MAGNVLFGRTGRITLRVFDVDDDYPGTDVAPELDRLVFNLSEALYAPGVAQGSAGAGLRSLATALCGAGL